MCRTILLNRSCRESDGPDPRSTDRRYIVMTKHVALITWAGLPEGAESEQLLLPHLKARGIEACLIDWRNRSVDLTGFDLLVLRSCWNYHLHAKEFGQWLDRAADAALVLNHPETVRWNSNKSYLQSLDDPAIRIAPTCFVSGAAGLDNSRLEQIRCWEKAVLKP